MLNKVNEFVNKYHPQSFTISVGGASGSGVTFTWENKTKPVLRYLAEVQTTLYGAFAVATNTSYYQAIWLPGITGKWSLEEITTNQE